RRACGKSGPMASPQTGIFALGTASHSYLELDATGDAAALAAAVTSLREPRTTMGGVNLVAGFRPELWRELTPEDTPADAAGFDVDTVGIEGFVMPATQHDAVLWISGSSYDVIFDVARGAIHALRGVATVGEETSSWSYHHDLDLTGFIDGTENPTLVEAQQVVAVPDGMPGAGGSNAAAPEVAARRRRLGVAQRRDPGAGDRTAKGRQRRARPEARGFARREHGPGHLRQDPPAQHGVRHRDR